MHIYLIVIFSQNVQKHFGEKKILHINCFCNCQSCEGEPNDISVLLGVFSTLTNIYDGVFFTSIVSSMIDMTGFRIHIGVLLDKLNSKIPSITILPILQYFQVLSSFDKVEGFPKLLRKSWILDWKIIIFCN